MLQPCLRRLLLPCVLLFCLATTALGADFSDVSQTDWFYSEIDLLVEKGVIAGYTDGSFRPTNSVTVGEFCKMLCTLWGYEPADQPDAHWAKEYVDLAYSYRWIDSYPSNLDALIVRLDVSSAVLASMGITAYTSSDQPFSDTDSAVAETMYEMGILNGSTTTVDGVTTTVFLPQSAITRAELCAILNRSYNYLESTFAVTDFRYQLPQVATPEGASTEADFLYQLLLYMMVTDTTTYELTYNGLTHEQLTNDYQLDSSIKTAYQAVRAEYHEIGAFYNTCGISYNTITSSAGYSVTTCTVEVKSDTMSTSELLAYKKAFLAAMPKCIIPIYQGGYVTTDMTDYEKAEYFYWWCAYNFQYDTETSPMSYNGFGLLSSNTGVCQAYVSVYNVMCKMAGIDIIGVSGTAGGEDHIWSYANLDGTWLYIDPTWGDPTPDRQGYCDYSYFGLTLEEISTTHSFG